MFSTLKAAEKAAMDGDGGEEFDTQKCNDLQEEFFSSSPARGNTPEPEPRDRHQPPLPDTYNHDVHVHLLNEHFKPQDLTHLATAIPRKPSSYPDPKLEPILPIAKRLVARRDSLPENAVTSKPSAQPTSFIRRNAQGQLRKFDSHGRELPMTRELRRAMEVENDLTQRSSMSLTQENSASAYENISVNRFATFQQSSVPDEAYFAKPATEAETGPVRTDSTPYTYHENDTGHITLDFDIGDTNQTSDSQNALSQDGASHDGDASQDNIHRRVLEPSSSQSQIREPQTPAPPVNPFANRGSVMNGAELFGATQPSAVGPRFVGSPTSSRPSPGVYNNFETPAPYRMVSSPLVHADRTPARSLRQIPQSTTLKPKSFDSSALKLGSSLFEPRRYNPMQVSQEKRQASSSASSSDEDSDIEAEPRQLRKQKQKVIKKQLSAVEFRLPSSSGAVEVPSTSGKRSRSAREVYVAQCDGSDGHDTQKDDVIADSQALPLGNIGESSPQGSPKTDLYLEGEQAIGQDAPASLTQPLPNSNRIFAPSCSKTVAQSFATHHPVFHGNSSPTRKLPLSQSSLPLQEVSTNPKWLATPSKAKGHDDDAVPETSPASQRSLRPMGDIGSFGPDEDDEDELNNIPGFTQDEGFEAVMNLRTASPKPSTRQPRRESKKQTVILPENAASVIPASSDVERFHAAPEASVEKIVSTMEQVPPEEIEQPSSKSNGEGSPEHIAVRPTSPDPINAIHSTPLPQVDPTIMNDPGEALAPESASKPAQAAEQSQSLFVTQLEPHVGMPMDVDDTIDEQIDDISKPPVPLQDESQPDLTIGTANEHMATEEAIQTAVRIAPATSSVVGKGEPRTNASTMVTPPQGSPAPADQEPSMMQGTASSLSSAPASTSATPQPEQVASKSGRKIARGRSVKAKAVQNPTSKATPKQTILAPKQNKRKAVVLKDSEESNRTSKRQSLRATREDSIDPLSLPSSAKGPRFGSKLFTGMALTLSYMKRDNRKGHEKDHERERDQMTKLIKENGGQVLEDGFENLFEDGPRCGQTAKPETDVVTSRRSLGFVAVIANIHSSKPKYMQALALGLPCLSPHWILSCVAKGSIVHWKPYLLCAGESPLLGVNFMSRHLTSYTSAAESRLVSTVAERPKILDGLSILAVGAKGIVDDKLKAFAFLGWVAAPERFCLLASFEDARKQLLKDEAEGVTWDLVFCDEVRRTVETAIFSNSPRNRKRASTANNAESPPKKVRVINKEDLLQSFILGQLIEDQSIA